MTRHRQVLNNVIAVVLLLTALSIVGYGILQRGTLAKPLAGWWTMTSGDPGFPNEMSVEIRDGFFVVRYPSSIRMRFNYLRLVADGQEHALSANQAAMLGGVTSYRAELNDKSTTLLLTKREQQLLPASLLPPGRSPEDVWTETWTVSPDRHQLTISSPRGNLTFERVPFLARLFKAAP